MESKSLVHYDKSSLEGLDVECIQGDVLDKDSLVKAFTGAYVVFHLAGRISIVSWDGKEAEASRIF